MGNTASANGGPKVTPQDKAILQMKVQRDNLTNTSKKLAIIINKETQIAKEAISRNDKRTLLLLLKKKKFQESSINRVNEQLLTLETLINTVEFKLVEKDFVYGLKEGSKLLKQLNQELSLEKVDKIMDSSELNIQYQQEVDLELSRNLNRADELEIDEELAALIKEQEGEQEPEQLKLTFPELPTHGILPEVPTNEITEPELGKKEEGKELESAALAV